VKPVTEASRVVNMTMVPESDDLLDLPEKVYWHLMVGGLHVTLEDN
jgi:hypothetical protein